MTSRNLGIPVCPLWGPCTKDRRFFGFYLLKLSGGGGGGVGSFGWVPVSGGVPRDEVAQVTETMVRKMCLEAALGPPS